MYKRRYKHFAAHTTIRLIIERDKLFIQVNTSSDTETGEACCDNALPSSCLQATTGMSERLKCEHEYFLSGMFIHS